MRRFSRSKEGKMPRSSTVPGQSLVTDRSFGELTANTVSADAEFFAKQNKKLAEENAKLQRKLDDQAEELDQLETFKMRVEQEAERAANVDKSAKAIRQSSAPGKAPRRSSWAGKPKGPVVSKAALDSINEKIASGERDANRPKGGAQAAQQSGAAALAAAGIDARKVMDELKKPLDDTRSIINEFASGRQVPTVLALAQAEAIRDTIRALEHDTAKCDGRLAALKQRYPDPRALSRAVRGRFEEAVSEMEAEQRRRAEEVKGLREGYGAKQDEVVTRSINELLKAQDNYTSAFEALGFPRDSKEGQSLDRVEQLCARFAPDAFAERMQNETGEPLLRQPADLGAAGGNTHMRTLLYLAERAEAASTAGGVMDRFAKEAASQGGPGCTVELASVKGFRRAIHKAHSEYSGDYLRLNDMCRCSIICPKYSALADCLRWIVDDAMVWAKDDADLPMFELLVAKDRLSHAFDADASDMYRYVLLQGKLACDGGVLLNVEIQLHVKRLLELRKTLHVLYEGRAQLGANDEAVSTHEGDLTKEIIAKAGKGTIRTLRCVDSTSKVDRGTLADLAAMLQANPCALTELSLSGTPGFESVDLTEGLLLGGGQGNLMCHRLRVLKLARLKLVGEIPKMLSRCIWLSSLELQDNWLHGKIPDVVGKLTRLETLALHGNSLDGLVPSEAICMMSRLQTLSLGGEAGGNDDLRVSAKGAKSIRLVLSSEAEIYLPTIEKADPRESAWVHKQAAEEAGLFKAGERAEAEEKEAAARAAAHEAAIKRKNMSNQIEAYASKEKAAALDKKNEATREKEAAKEAEDAKKAAREHEREMTAMMAEDVLASAAQRKREEEEAQLAKAQVSNRAYGAPVSQRDYKPKKAVGGGGGGSAALGSLEEGDEPEPEMERPERKSMTQKLFGGGRKSKSKRSSKNGDVAKMGAPPGLQEQSDEAERLSHRRSHPPSTASGLTAVATPEEWGAGATGEAGHFRL